MADESTQKVLLSGVSGMIGTAIRRELSGRQVQTLQLSRSTTLPRPRQTETPEGGSPAGTTNAFQFVAVSISGEVPWNPSATPAVAHPELLEGLSAAIHLSGANVASRRWTPEYKHEIASSRIETTHALARTLAALRHPPPTLLIASATGIYGNRGNELLDESSPVGTGFLAGVCGDWEEAARPAVEAGIRVVHMRFGVVLAPPADRGALAKMIPLFKWGLGGKLGPGTQWMSWIAIDDLVAAVAFVLKTADISGPVNFTAPNAVTNAQFTWALARHLHRPAIFPVPAAALRLAVGEVADEALLSSARAVPAKLSGAGFSFSYPFLDQALTAVLAKK